MIKEEDNLSKEIIGAAIEVHSHLGPGLLEAAYEECLCREMSIRGLTFERQKPLAVSYKGVKLDLGILINFNVPLLKEGIKRIVNGL